MISSSGGTGGGPILISILCRHLYEKFNFFFAIPHNEKIFQLLEKENYNQIFNISERKIKIKELINLSIFIKFNSIDIIHSHGKGAAFIGRLIALCLNKPHIYTFHGIHMQCYGKVYVFFYRIYEFFFGFLDSRKVFVSKSEKQFAKNSGIYFRNNYSIIHNGVISYDEKNKNQIRNKLRRAYKIDNIEKCIISVCRFVPQKNIFEFIEIAGLCKEFKFFLIGDGPLKSEINLYIKKLNLKNIYLTGMITNVFDYLCFCDLFLSTSIYEGLPLSIIEAMSVGLPIVASKVTGNIDTIEDRKTGFFYDLGNPIMAAKKIKLILSNENLMKEIGLRSKLRQKNLFDSKKMAAEYQKIYKSFI
jgi:glycosyltransferase involved in cell wall biosynthesis